MVDMSKVNPCGLLIPGSALRKACDDAENQANNAPASSNGNSFFGIPIPGSNWMRHFMFRVGEVIVGIAMIVVGIKAFTNSGPTIKLITQTGSKIAKKVN